MNTLMNINNIEKNHNCKTNTFLLFYLKFKSMSVYIA